MRAAETMGALDAPHRASYNNSYWILDVGDYIGKEMTYGGLRHHRFVYQHTQRACIRNCQRQYQSDIYITSYHRHIRNDATTSVGTTTNANNIVVPPLATPIPYIQSCAIITWSSDHPYIPILVACDRNI